MNYKKLKSRLFNSPNKKPVYYHCLIGKKGSINDDFGNAQSFYSHTKVNSGIIFIYPIFDYNNIVIKKRTLYPIIINEFFK